MGWLDLRPPFHSFVVGTSSVHQEHVACPVLNAFQQVEKGLSERKALRSTTLPLSSQARANGYRPVGFGQGKLGKLLEGSTALDPLGLLLPCRQGSLPEVRQTSRVNPIDGKDSHCLCSVLRTTHDEVARL